jgi:UDP-N-acetylmuramate--alanine ligase
VTTVFEPGARVHIVGVGGAGMSGLARLLAELGCRVSGSDSHKSPALDELRAAGVEVHLGHDRTFGAASDVVLWSPAVGPDNVELATARLRGATLLTRAEVLAELGRLSDVIGLTGTHGKTTATSMMVHVLHAAGRDDSRLLGAPVTGVGANGHWGTDSLVLEVDESYGTFSLLEPSALGLLNVEADHLDHYGSLDALEAAFAALARRTTGPVVAWVDDPGVRRVARLAEREFVTVGTDQDATWRVSKVVLARRSASFDLDGPDGHLVLELNVIGAHNVANAAVVAVLAWSLGVDPKAIRTGLAAFQGAPRRFEFLGQWRGVDVYEDYAHLPGEIIATLAATRTAGYSRITCVFQPHRVTRTTNLAEAFATAFGGADHLVVSDIYSAGEPNPTGVTGELIVAGVARHSSTSTTYAASFEEVLAVLEPLHDVSDVVLFLGAGDIATVAARLSGGLV